MVRHSSARGRASSLWLSSLLFLLPFEPRDPALHVLGAQTTLLEAAAGIAGLALLWLTRARLASLLGRPPLPLLLLAGYAGAHVVATVAAPEPAAASLKFALRMIVMAGFALVVAALPSEARRAGLAALAASGVVVAALAVAEVAGLRSLDPFLARFRESPFNVGGWRRATAGSEYPNLAAAMLASALVAVAGVAARRGARLLLVAPWAALVCAGLLATYSRGAWIAAGTALAVLMAAAARIDRTAVRGPAVVLAILVVSGAAAAARPAFRLRLETEGTSSWYGAMYAPAERTLRLAPGETRTALVRVKNTGQRTWAVDDGFHLSYHWYDLERHVLGDGGRVALPRDLATGESADLRAVVRAPGGTGTYLLGWDMVHEHTTWFSEQGVRPAVVVVVVAPIGAAPPAPTVLEMPASGAGWRPGRAELWRLAVQLWAERPLLGWGSDSYRHLYGARAGRDVWDERVFANDTLLEAAATTGAAGALCLVGAIVAAAVAALRAIRRGGDVAAPAFLGLLVGLAAHGVVDYVLAFTGHYLLFGFVIGGIAALERPEPAAAA